MVNGAPVYPWHRLGSLVCNIIGRLACRDKSDRDRIHTVTSVFIRQVFSFEDVTEVTAAGIAQYFDTKTIGVDFSANGSLNFVIKGGPSAVRLELIL